MAYEPTGMQALFPVYLARMIRDGGRREEYDISVAQNEANLNQNLTVLHQKITELETVLAGLSTAADSGEATE